MSAPQVHPAAFVDPAAKLAAGVVIEPGAIVGPHVQIGEGTRIGSYARVTGWTRLGAHCQVHHCAVVGGPPQDLKYTGAESYLEVGDHTVVREFATLHLAAEPGNSTRIGSHCLIMAYAHVAHDCQVGNHVVMSNSVQLAGFVTLEDWVILGGLAAVHQFTRVGCHAMVGGAARVTQDVAPYIKLGGIPIRLAGLNAIGLERRGFSAETIAALEAAYKIMFRRDLPIAEAVTRLRAELPGVPEVEHLARFAETSARGLTR